MTNTDNLLILNDNNFNETISNGITLVDFYADWCMPCKIQTPILEKIAKSIGDKAKIGKLNVDQNSQSAYEYNVMSIPTLILFKEGKPVKQFVGVQNESILLNAIQNA